MDNNIKAQEAELLTQQISINDKEVFEEALSSLGSDKSKAEAIAAQMNRTTNEMMQKDPEFYTRFSVKIRKLLEEMRLKKIADIEALKQAKLIQDEILNKKDKGLPKEIALSKGSDIFYRNLLDKFDSYDVPQDEFIKIILDIRKTINDHNITDWYLNPEQIRIMTNAIDDYLYDVVYKEKGINLSNTDRVEIEKQIIELAKNNFEVLN